MSIVFNLIYLAVMAMFSPWLLWRVVVQKKNRRGWSAKLFGHVPGRTSHGPCFWFHAVSVGEVNLLKPVIAAIRRQRPEIEIAISSTTETGRQLAAECFPDDITFFCPADFSWAIRRTLRRLRPDQLILAELELWPNLINIAASKSVPVSVINGRLSEKSSRGYQKLGFLFRSIFEKISWIGAQSDEYAKRFVANGCEAKRVTVTGSVKFDGVETCRNSPAIDALKRVASQCGVREQDFVFLGGSTQLDEDLLLVEAYQNLKSIYQSLRLILVPRHPGRVTKLCRELEMRNQAFVLRSSPKQTDAADAVLIVDVIGELSNWWAVADAGFVGGSMGNRGGQSMIEPAGKGVPVCFGPHTENFKSTVSALIQNDAAEVVHHQRQLESFMKWSMDMPHLAQSMGRRAKQSVARNFGAADRTVAGILGAGYRPQSPPPAKPAVPSAA
jgi:3-deoxy-D-manno-octulosonic-acid transferase